MREDASNGKRKSSFYQENSGNGGDNGDYYSDDESKHPPNGYNNAERERSGNSRPLKKSAVDQRDGDDG